MIIFTKIINIQKDSPVIKKLIFISFLFLKTISVYLDISYNFKLL